MDNGEGVDTLMGSEVLHVVGARPNMPKAAPVIRAFAEAGAAQCVVDTGQHYDEAMSGALMVALGMPAPDVELGVGSGSHAAQTAAILTAIEAVLIQRDPRIVMVYGDVNSTLAAALAAAKIGIPVAHVEAGLRSHDASMPEEINRRLVDHVSSLLFVTSPDAWENLRSEGLADERALEVGNPMIDSLVATRDRIDFAKRREELGLPDEYVIATIHRPSNVDDPQAAAPILSFLADLGSRLPVLLPLHPRSRPNLTAAADLPGLRVCDPMGYPDFLAAVEGARAVVTDSGGVQEETSFLGVPCVTIRTTTERPVTITHGTNRLTSIEGALTTVDRVLQQPRPAPAHIPLWDGHAGERIAATVLDWLASRESRSDA